MIYRMRIYQAVRENLPIFHQFFHERLWPIYQNYDMQFIGRWETDDGRVVAIFSYKDRAAYEQVRTAIQEDPAFIAAHNYRQQELPPLFTEYQDVLMSATGQEV